LELLYPREVSKKLFKNEVASSFSPDCYSIEIWRNFWFLSHQILYHFIFWPLFRIWCAWP